MDHALSLDVIQHLIADSDPRRTCLLAQTCKPVSVALRADAVKFAAKQRKNAAKRALIDGVKLEVFHALVRLWQGYPRIDEVVRTGAHGFLGLYGKLDTEESSPRVHAFRNGTHAYITIDHASRMLLRGVRIMVYPETPLRGHVRLTHRIDFLDLLSTYVGYHRGVLPALEALGLRCVID